MKKLIVTIIVLILLLPLKVFSQEYVEFDPPPLLLLTADEAAKLRDIVAAAPYDKAYKTLIADADALLGDRPNPLKDIIYEGRVSNHPDRLNSVKHLQDMNKIYTLTWANFVSGDSKYGAKAIEFVAAWAEKCKPSGNDVNDNKLLTCMAAYQMLGKEMTKAQKEKIGKWIKSIGDAQQKGWSDNKRGNHAGKRLKLIYFAAYLENDKDRIKWVQPKIQKIWNSTLFASGETYDFQRRDAVHYHFSTISAFLQVAQIGRLTGRDHYNQEADNGGSIAKAIEFALPYIKGEKIHPEWVNTIVKLDKDRWAKAGDPYYKPGKPWDPWEAYKSLMLASVFDESLHDLAEKLRQDKNKPLPWLGVLAKASLADDLNSSHTDHSLTATVPGPVKSGLIVTDLGKSYSYNPEVTPANLYFDNTDKGGNTSTSVRNDSYDNIEWKDDEGYYQRNRDLGMIFNPVENIVLDAIVLRTSGSNKAVKTGAPDAPVIMQIFEVVGRPVLNNNGTGAGDTAEGRYQDCHASDDYVEGVEYVQLLLATGGTFPIHDVTSSSNSAGKLRFMRWDITNDMQLIGGKRYMFLVGFENPIFDCSIALANINPITDQCDNGDNIYFYTDCAGEKWWGVRREGNSTYPPTRAPGSDPISEPREPLRSQLKTESMFENDRLTNPDDDPVSDGFPSIDTYRTLQFYIETTDGGTPPEVLTVSTSTSAPTTSYTFDNLSLQTPADHVNALMGTAPLTDMTLYGGPNYHPDPNLIGFSGTVYPGPDVPHGMVQLSPYNNLVGTPGVDDTRYGSGYFYPDKSILGFGHTNKGHWRGGAVIMMPTVGKLQIVPGSLQDPDGGYRSRFKHANEEATAGYYSVVLDDYDIKVELSALTYTGFHRYTFPETDEANILIDLGRTHRCIPDISFQIVDDTHIQGTQEIRSGLYSFYIEFSKPFKAYGTWKDGKVEAGSRSASGINAGAYVTYSTTAGETIEVKIALSRNSVADAMANWDAEAKDLDFAAARAKAKGIWNDKLSMIEIEGGTPKQRENFYSTFYRSLQWPPISTDFSADEPVYEWPSIWDTFRNKQPLLTLIEPEVKQDIVRSMVEKAKLDGKMYTHFHGNHASSIITASYLSGLDDFDIEAAYTYLKKNQTDRTIIDKRHMQFLDEYLDNGYVATVDPVPTETRKKSRSAVAKTMEYAFDDGVMAILAEKLGKTEDAHAFMEGSKKYKNVYEPTTGIMWGRKPNGDFVQPVKPMEPFHTYMFREANAWQQTWFVPHDIPGLAELMGGRQACIDKLDEFFTKPYEPEGTLIDIGGMIGQYNHGNQPDHHAPYIYNYLGQPWKTQQRVREIMDKMYRGNVYTGMDDCGEMSAWYVWSAMGIYPFNPSSLVYLIGSPIFDRVTIHLPQFKYGGAKFVIEAKKVSETNMYIQSATLNGAKYDKPWISFQEIATGSTLTLQMGPNPSDWATDLANVPPSKL